METERDFLPLHFLFFLSFSLNAYHFSRVSQKTLPEDTYIEMKKTSVKSDQECSSYRIKRYLPTAVWARNLKWELLNGKPLSILFRTELSIYYDFFDCTMNFGYVGGTWWSPRKYWWLLLVISTPMLNYGGYAAKIHYFTEVMCWQNHILGWTGCTKTQFGHGPN